jgi:cystathionine beta-lyase/cystathionine gamma-synthase
VGAYLAALVAGLRREVGECLRESKSFAALEADIERLERECSTTGPEPDYATWRRLMQDYRSLLHRKACAANESASVARVYQSMAEFWEDADAQERGESRHTFWDTYEHGRRRQYEQIFARAYGASSALLLNSGMSTIAVVVGMLNLCAGSKILTGMRCYFETSDFLARYVSQAGVEVIRVPVDEPGRLTAALREFRPALAILETVTNVPGVPITRGHEEWLQASPDTFFLLDNSVQSHLTRWFDILPEDSRVLVAESATKYLAEECMAGVIYGHSEAVDRAREFARATGQQLQEKAFNYLSEANVELAGCKLLRHSRNVAAFAEELAACSTLFDFVRTLDANIAAAPESAAIFARGRGALIFLALRSHADDSEDLARRHRLLLESWREKTLAAGLELQIRAGFGWNQTSARVYESGRLNQADAPCFLRVSVGSEPTSAARAYGRLLGEAAREISAG